MAPDPLDRIEFSSNPDKLFAIGGRPIEGRQRLGQPQTDDHKHATPAERRLRIIEKYAAKT